SSRVRQLHHIAQCMQKHEHAILMGDLNCEPDSSELLMLLDEAAMNTPMPSHPSFPSWQPQRSIDHILTRGDAQIVSLQTIPFVGSDHLPVVAEITFPAKDPQLQEKHDSIVASDCA
ncbi:MAG: endonuclease/exonuclease/phosphatase family protein, partial [Mariprofundaceae bacterium]|nr:endonuclease/exonuclease/phosphatase family protein [Mariprofundaceae bacterium]